MPNARTEGPGTPVILLLCSCIACATGGENTSDTVDAQVTRETKALFRALRAQMGDAMRRALDLTETTGMAVFYDHGPSLHPANKQPAGERLALWALAKDYGCKDLVHCGPLLDTVTIDGGKAVLTFKHVGGGLKSVSGGKKLKFFEIAGKDGKYVLADASIEGDTVVVRSGEIVEPAYVRYLFRKPQPSAEDCLCASGFRGARMCGNPGRIERA